MDGTGRVREERQAMPHSKVDPGEVTGPCCAVCGAMMVRNRRRDGVTITFEPLTISVSWEGWRCLSCNNFVPEEPQ